MTLCKNGLIYAMDVETVSPDAKTIKASCLCKGIYSNKIALTNTTGRICEIELFGEMFELGVLFST